MNCIAVCIDKFSTILPDNFTSEKRWKELCNPSKGCLITVFVLLIITAIALVISGCMGIAGSYGASAPCAAICNALTIPGVSIFTTTGILVIFSLVSFAIHLAKKRDWQQDQNEFCEEFNLSCIAHYQRVQSSFSKFVIQDFEENQDREQMYRTLYLEDSHRIIILISHQKNGKVQKQTFTDSLKANQYLDKEANGYTYHPFDNTGWTPTFHIVT